MYTISLRPAELSGGEFTYICTAYTPQEARDEVLSWMWGTPAHGDLVRVANQPSVGIPLGDTTHMEGPYENLYVFDCAKGSFVDVEPNPAHVSWVDFWEGSANLHNMLGVAKQAPPQRLVLTACDFAEISIHNTGTARKACLDALRVARVWARGQKQAAGFLRIARDRLARMAYAMPVSNQTSAIKAVCLAVSIAELVSRTSNWDEVPLSDKGRVTSEMFRIAWCAVSSLTAQESIPRALKVFVPILREYVPLSVLACSQVGARDPLNLPK